MTPRPMRLLLLLSAILSALTGVSGTRATAEPITASASIAPTLAPTRPGAVALAPALARFDMSGALVHRQLAFLHGEPRRVYPLYADRRRE